MSGSDQGGVVQRPDVYPLAAYLADHHRADWIISVGCGPAHELDRCADEFFFAGLDTEAKLAACRGRYPFATWLDVDLENPSALPLTDDQVRGSVIVCSDMIGSLLDPQPLLQELCRMREQASVILVTTPDRTRTSQDWPHHQRQRWDAEQFRGLLTASGLEPAFLGYTVSNDADWQKSTILAVIEGSGAPPLEAAPESFRVLAVVTGFNEKDIVGHTLRRLLSEGLEVVYLDNWSNDGSFEMVEAEFAESVRALRFPEVDTHTFDWIEILGKVEALGIESGADWVIHHDADEWREGPWPGLNLRDSVWNVHRRGFTAINHHVIEFRPIRGEPVVADGMDPTDALLWWHQPLHPANLIQVKGWRNEGQAVDLAGAGGHEVKFPGRKIFPYRFLLRHYPLRSPEHARRKIFAERRNRWNKEERALGWHAHYDDVAQDDAFLWPKEDFLRWDREVFHREFLVERLTSIGARRGEVNEWNAGVTNPPTAARVAWQGLREALQNTTAEFERVAADQADHLAQTQHALELRKEQLAVTKRSLREAEQALEAGERAHAKTRRALAKAERSLARTERALERVTGSASWRMTAPLRATAARVRGSGRG